MIDDILGQITLSMYSYEVRTCTGSYHKGDFAYWEDGGLRGGILERCFMGRLVNGQVVFLIVVSVHTPVAAGFGSKSQHTQLQMLKRFRVLFHIW